MYLILANVAGNFFLDRIVILSLILLIILSVGLLASGGAAMLNFVAPKRSLPPFNPEAVLVASVVSVVFMLALGYLHFYFIELVYAFCGIEDKDPEFTYFVRTMLIHFPVIFFMLYALGSFVASCAIRLPSLHAILFLIFYIFTYSLIGEILHFPSLIVPVWLNNSIWMGLIGFTLWGSIVPFEKLQDRLR